MIKLQNQRGEIERNFTFRVRNEPIPGDLRPIWRISMLMLMLLRAGYGGGMSLKKALILNWGVRSAEARSALLRMVEGERRLDDVPVRLDPALNRTLDFAVAEGLIHVKAKTTGSIISLESPGFTLARKLYDFEGCMELEKTFFNQLRGRIPESKVKELLSWEAAK